MRAWLERIAYMNTLKKTFLFPQDEFSPAPFWFLNDDLNRDELKKQLLDFYNKGIRTIVLHPRKGLPSTIPYLSEVFLDYIEYIVKEAVALGVKVILYDEGMYPSGSCNGQVVKKNPAFAAKGLQKHSYVIGEPMPVFGDGNWFVCAALVRTQADGSLNYVGFSSMEEMISAYTETSEPSEMVYFTLVYSNGTIRGVHEGEDDGELNAPKAADLLDVEAVRTFISLTHEVYYNRLKEYFGNTIISFFTDEPSIMGRRHLNGLIPWSHDVLQLYLNNGGTLDSIGQLFEKDSPINYESKHIYKQTINYLLGENYYKQISDWCEAHGVALSGHPEESEDIGFLQYFQIPCQDIVWRYVDPDLKNGLIGTHSTMGKCSSDAARHGGRRRNGNECFGACGHKGDPWNFPFTDMMWYMNWLFARGVNLLLPHAFYYSLRDERRNERPPDVGPNSPWWDNYLQISTYIRRMSWLNTDSVNMTDIAVLCSSDHLPWKPVHALYENQIEFNYLETDLLQKCTLVEDALQIEKQSYRVVLIEDGLPIDKTAQTVLERFQNNGGRVLRIADFCDGETLSILKTYNPLALRVKNNFPDLRITHVIKENMHFYMMFNESDASFSFEASTPVTGSKEIWNPWEGTFTELDGKTFSITLNAYEALILAVLDDSYEEIQKA